MVILQVVATQVGGVWEAGRYQAAGGKLSLHNRLGVICHYLL